MGRQRLRCLRIYNKCDLGTLTTLARLTMWLIHLDDKVDCQGGDLHGDSTQLSSYIDKVRLFVSQCLGLSEVENLAKDELDDFLVLFEPIGQQLKQLPRGIILPVSSIPFREAICGLSTHFRRHR